MNERLHARICAVVEQIPPGRVASYGQIASIVGNCTARMVGHAMASLPHGSGVPWQRVINAQGRVSPRGDQHSSQTQRLRLEEEGVHFSSSGSVDWRSVRWAGPPIEWLLEHGYAPGPSYTDTWEPAALDPAVADGAARNDKES
jgi:methylated-DNA-protein-cysteine methyltransferase-like protein